MTRPLLLSLLALSAAACAGARLGAGGYGSESQCLAAASGHCTSLAAMQDGPATGADRDPEPARRRAYQACMDEAAVRCSPAR